MKIKGFQDTIEWYNQNAAHYAQAADMAFTPNDRQQMDQFISFLKPGSKILDAGCGSGRDTHSLAAKGFNTVGIDLSHGLITIAKKNYPTLTFIEGNLLKLPFSESTFDGIWAHASLLHFETIDDIKISLNELHRVLNETGILHVLVKAPPGNKKSEVIKDKYSKEGRFFQFYTLPEIQELVKNAGFLHIFSEQFNDTRNHPHGRPDVEWVVILARKK